MRTIGPSHPVCLAMFEGNVSIYTHIVYKSVTVSRCLIYTYVYPSACLYVYMYAHMYYVLLSRAIYIYNIIYIGMLCVTYIYIISVCIYIYIHHKCPYDIFIATHPRQALC